MITIATDVDGGNACRRTQLSTLNCGEGKCEVKMQVCVEVLNLRLSMTVTISFSFLENVLTRSHSTVGKRKD